MQELNDATDQLKSKRRRHERSQKNRNTHLLRLCNKAIEPHEQPPPNWKDATIKVRYKSGDPATPSNYRPICSIPIVYKLFSQFLFKRQLPTLDHSFTFQQLRRRATEWHQPLWVAATDFKKNLRRSGAQQRVGGLEGVEDPNTNLSNLRFADDILLISGSLKHTTTMADDLTTATTAHGLQLHPTKTQIISNTTSKSGGGRTCRV